MVTRRTRKQVGDSIPTQDESSTVNTVKDMAEVVEPTGEVDKESVDETSRDASEEEDTSINQEKEETSGEEVNENDDQSKDKDDLSMMSEAEIEDGNAEASDKSDSFENKADTVDVDKRDNTRGGNVDEYAEKSTRECYIGGLVFGISEIEVRNLCKPYGTINSVKIMKGFAFVVFDTRESALACTDGLHDTQYEGRTLRVNVCSDRKQNNSPSPAPADNKKVVVRNLSFDTNEETIRKMLKNCGVISECVLPTFQDSGRNRGWCIVTFASTEAVERALALGTMSIDGRMVRVEMHYPRDQRDSGRFGSPKFGRPKRPFNSGGRDGYRGGDRNGGDRNGGDRNGGYRRQRFDRDGGSDSKSSTPYAGKRTTFND